MERRLAATVLVLLAVASGTAATYVSAGASPSSPPLEFGVVRWTAAWVQVPPAGPLPAPWLPNGSCTRLSGTVSPTSPVRCELDLGHARCTAGPGNSSACSYPIAATVAPPYSAVTTVPTGVFCPSGGCAYVFYLSLSGPSGGSAAPMNGVVLYAWWFVT